MVRYVSRGIVAQSDCALLTCRRRQIASISFCGSALVFSRSRNEERVLRPGVDEESFLVGTCGAGGGGGNGDEEVDSSGDAGDSVGVTVGIGTASFFLSSWILSLYASFNSLMSRRPSLFINYTLAPILRLGIWYISPNNLTLLPFCLAFPCISLESCRIAE